MKCKECDCCHEIVLSKWSNAENCWVTENVYKCWGVAEPFVIDDINHECTEYGEYKNKTVMTNADRIRSMTDEELAESKYIPCPYDDGYYGECKYGWHEPEQTCEECKLEWLRMPSNK
jgi:hypothetical protein